MYTRHSRFDILYNKTSVPYDRLKVTLSVGLNVNHVFFGPMLDSVAHKITFHVPCMPEGADFVRVKNKKKKKE